MSVWHPPAPALPATHALIVPIHADGVIELWRRDTWYAVWQCVRHPFAKHKRTKGWHHKAPGHQVGVFPCRWGEDARLQVWDLQRKAWVYHGDAMHPMGCTTHGSPFLNVDHRPQPLYPTGTSPTLPFGTPEALFKARAWLDCFREERLQPDGHMEVHGGTYGRPTFRGVIGSEDNTYTPVQMHELDVLHFVLVPTLVAWPEPEPDDDDDDEGEVWQDDPDMDPSDSLPEPSLPEASPVHGPSDGLEPELEPETLPVTLVHVPGLSD